MDTAAPIKDSDNGVVIRQAQRTDMVYVSEMIQELADFEKMSDGPKLSAKDLERDAFDSNPPAFRCKVAEVGGSLLGYALYFPTYSTWEGRSMLLEDLYVKPAERCRGVGGKLFNAVAKEALSEGSRLDLHVLDWNPALSFYTRRNVRVLTREEGWLYCRLSSSLPKATQDL